MKSIFSPHFAFRKMVVASRLQATGSNDPMRTKHKTRRVSSCNIKKENNMNTIEYKREVLIPKAMVVAKEEIAFDDGRRIRVWSVKESPLGLNVCILGPVGGGEHHPKVEPDQQTKLVFGISDEAALALYVSIGSVLKQKHDAKGCYVPPSLPLL